ncbi:MAG: hypothetical protein ABL866_14195 [Devosia sp.]
MSLRFGMRRPGFGENTPRKGGGWLFTAPVLAWTTDGTDNTPAFTCDVDPTAVGSDIVRVQVSSSSSFASISQETTTTVTLLESSLGLSALADGTWYVRARMERPSGTAVSAWSNTVNQTISTFSLTWTDHEEVTADGATPSYPTLSIGAADARRVIAVAYSGRETSGTDTVTLRLHTPSIAADPTGVLMTMIGGSYATSAGNMMSQIGYLAQASFADATATTAEVSAVLASGQQRSSISVARIITSTPAPTNSGAVAASAPADTVQNLAATVPAGGAGFAIAGYRAANAGDVAWTNATKDYSVNQMETFSTISSAHFSASATLTAQVSGGGVPIGSCLSYASWGP